MSQNAKCPKCGEIEQVEITKTWGHRNAGLYALLTLDVSKMNPVKQEIYCNTCGQVSIIDADTSSHTDEAKSPLV